MTPHRPIAAPAHPQEAAINDLTAIITRHFNRCKAMVEGMDAMASGACAARSPQHRSAAPVLRCVAFRTHPCSTILRSVSLP